MSNIDEDIYCIKQPFDSTLFPVGSANFMNRSSNILPFLCNLLQYANDETVSPVIVEAPEFDITPFTDFTGLTAVGDPRISLGETMSATFINFLPRMIAQTEVMQSGGTQVIENIICNADGIPIKESRTIPVLLSLDLSGQKPYQYGALTVPPITQTIEELMTPINPTEVTDYVNNYVYNSKKDHITYFSQFLQTYFLSKGWTTSLIAYNIPPMFLVKLDKDSKTVYIKYYTDVQNEVACTIGATSILTHFGTSNVENRAMIVAIGNQIPDYKYLLQNPDKAQEWYNYLINNTIASVDENYANLFTSVDTATAYIAKTDSLNVPIISAVQVNCNISTY
jgi:hypothetical protein